MEIRFGNIAHFKGSNFTKIMEQAGQMVESDPWGMSFPQGLEEVAPGRMQTTNGIIVSTEKDTLRLLRKLGVKVDRAWDRDTFRQNVSAAMDRKHGNEMGSNIVARYFQRQLQLAKWKLRWRPIKVVNVDE